MPRFVISHLFLPGILLFFISCNLPSPSETPEFNRDIRMNQLGFFTSAPKIAVIKNAPSGVFQITSTETGEVVFQDSLGISRRWEYSDEVVRLADFSDFKESGKYQIEVPLAGNSIPFEISSNQTEVPHKEIVRSFYYQRASAMIDRRYGGKWARPLAHPDLEVKVHPSASSAVRPAGTVVTSSRGWYDAGDYGKYIPTATYSTWMLLALYEHYPEYYGALSLNLPESSNPVPDILDEAIWSIRWMLTMQDPSEGFVAHKLTTTKHAATILPEDDQATRLIIGKSTPATLGFAAVMALAARIFGHWEQELPGLADSCLNAAQKAWQWGIKNPEVYFENPPEITTGPCRDTRATDELAWAAAELFVTTGQDSFYRKVDFVNIDVGNAPSRRDVDGLALITLLANWQHLGNTTELKILEGKIQTLADRYRDYALSQSAFGIVIGEGENDFIWGSNGIAASQGMLLIFWGHQTRDESYVNAALSNWDYLMGRNALSYCFLTGFGYQSPQHIHHRVSEADGIPEPLPGLMPGGPQNELNRDNCPYASDLPALTYLDDYCSFTTNEVAINWNAPLAYLSGALSVWYKEE